MKYLSSAFCVIGVLLAGCDQESQPVTPAVEKSPTVMDTEIGNFVQTNELNFGDVEANFRMEVTVADSHLPPNSNVEELRSPSLKKLTLVTVDIEEQAPSTLPIIIDLVTKEDFTASPVVVRGKLIREVEIGQREVVFTFNTVMDVLKHNRSDPNPTIGPFPARYTADGLKDLDEMPPTILLYLEVEALLMGIDTDKSTLDLTTVSAGPDNTGTLLSNALRINYTAPPAPAAPAPPEEAPAEVTPAEVTQSGDGEPAEEVPAAESTASEAPATENAAAE
jgi:hypothetical protein